MIEDDRFVHAQKAFGYPTRFDLGQTAHCMQSYITDSAHAGVFVIPSSLVWTAALANGVGFKTQTGASWPRLDEDVRVDAARQMLVSYKQCLTSPSVLTADFLRERGVERISMASILDGQTELELGGKVVILALGTSDVRRFRGPGDATATDDGIIGEHLLAARFLDGLLTGEIIRRETLTRYPALDWLPVAAGGGLFLASLFLSTMTLVALAAAGVFALIGMSGLYLLEDTYLVPIQTMASLAATAGALTLLYGYLRYYGMRRQVRFSNDLNLLLSQCNTLGEIEQLSRERCQREFLSVEFAFLHYDRELYEASSDTKAALALLDRRRALDVAPDVGPGDETRQMMAKRVGRSQGVTRMPFRAASIDLQLDVQSKLGRLGTIKLGIGFLPHEEAFLGSLVEILRVEVAQHWHRIKLLVDQKLLDYQMLMERTRGDIMERFLTHVIVSKFQDNKTMEENLKAVLTPRPTRAALLQADIRGYSRVSAQMQPLEMVKLLQGYFSNVVDAAQLVAQVKLIGDCIFLFIEEQAASETSSPADLALDLAAILIAETNAQNAIRRKTNSEELFFGIAIHYGDVVVGNLSSDSCIDYTVIGPNVNLVARLEELTKNAAVAQAIGINGVILSTDAQAALKKYQGVAARDIVLDDLGVAVRSFANVRRVAGLDAEAVLALASPSASESSDPSERLRKVG